MFFTADLLIRTICCVSCCSGAKVTLGGDESGEEVTIFGINDSGYLQVRRPSGDIVVVQPDGNSFDMMKGLVIVRKA